VFASVLRRLTNNGFRKGMAGSTPWLIVGILAAGIRVLQRIARDGDEILYRTVVESGDVFEVVARPK